MERMLRVATIVLAVALFLTGCTKSENAKAPAPDPTGNELVTFVELGSDGCIPCKMMQPIMKEIESKYRGQVQVVFHDVWTDAGKPYIKKYAINVIPTQVFLDAEGVEFFRHEGFFPKDQLIAVLTAKGVK